MHRYFVISFLLAATAFAVAQSTHDPTLPSRPIQGANPARRVVALETVLELARLKAPAIAAAAALVSLAEERRRGATRFADPRATVGLGHGKFPNGTASATETSFEVSQMFPLGIRSRKRAGNAAIEFATRQVDTAILDVLRETTIRYYEAALGASRAAALAQAADDARSLSDLVARRVEVGEAAGADHLRTKVEAMRAQSEARAAEAQADGARAALNRFLLGALDSDFAFPSDLDPGVLPELSSLSVEQVVARNAAVHAAQARVQAAQTNLIAERAVRLPGIEISAYSQSELDRRAAGVTIGLAIPLWNRNQAEVGIARAELAEAEADASALRAAIEADVERLLRRDVAARESAATYRLEILPAARETLAIVRSSLEQGEANLLAWLEARRSFLETLRASYDAQLDAFLTRAELQRLIGDPYALD